MRKAAGIIMMTLGMAWLGIHFSGGAYDPEFTLLIITAAAFLITGGVFCLRRKYWKVCLASTVFLVIPLFLWSIVLPDAVPHLGWLSWIFMPAGILPIILVCLGKREWQKKQG